MLSMKTLLHFQRFQILWNICKKLKLKSKKIKSRIDKLILTVNAFTVFVPEPLFLPNENKAENKLVIIRIRKITITIFKSIISCPVKDISYYEALEFNLQF